MRCEKGANGVPLAPPFFCVEEVCAIDLFLDIENGQRCCRPVTLVALWTQSVTINARGGACGGRRQQ